MSIVMLLTQCLPAAATQNGKMEFYEHWVPETIFPDIPYEPLINTLRDCNAPDDITD
jgi:hypothetical protein